MYLNDITPGSRISIRAVDREHPENSVEVTTDVIEQLMDTRGHHVAFASPIYIDDKVLSTNEGRSVFDVYYFDPELKRVYEWRHTPVRYVLCKNRRCYILVSVHIAVLFHQRLFAVHHPGLGAFAQFFDHCSSNISHGDCGNHAKNGGSSSFQSLFDRFFRLRNPFTLPSFRNLQACPGLP